jgi:hypothetical protein
MVEWSGDRQRLGGEGGGSGGFGHEASEQDTGDDDLRGLQDSPGGSFVAGREDQVREAPKLSAKAWVKVGTQTFRDLM